MSVRIVVKVRSRGADEEVSCPATQQHRAIKGAGRVGTSGGYDIGGELPRVQVVRTTSAAVRKPGNAAVTEPDPKKFLVLQRNRAPRDQAVPSWQGRVADME